MARDQAKMIKIVQDLWRKADDPATPDPEKIALVEKANELMAKYQIEEIVLNEAKPANQQEEIIVAYVRLTEDGKTPMVTDQRAALYFSIARWNRVRAVHTSREATVDPDTEKAVAGGRFITLIGFRSDVEWTRDFSFVICYDMMEAMFNEPQQKTNYREQFCTGFVERIDQRLKALKQKVDEAAKGSGMELVIVRRDDLVKAEVNKMFPRLGTYKVSARSKYDPTARSRGAAATNKSDLGQGKVGGSSRKELG